MKKTIYTLAICLITATCFALPSDFYAIWAPNTESDIAGYFLYWRNPTGTFNDTDKVQIDHPTTEVHLTGLVGRGDIIAVTAFDTSGNESDFSEELPFTGAPSMPSGLGIERR